MGLIPGLGRSPGGGNGTPLQYILAWKIQWAEESGRLQSMGPQRVRHDWVTEHSSVQFSSVVQLLSHIRLSATPWTAARQASLSITNSQSLPKLLSIESVIPSNHLIHCHPLLLLPSIFPGIRVFLMSQFFSSGGQSIGVSALASVLPKNIQDWSPLGWTGWISLQSKGLSRVFSNTTVQKHQFSALSFLYSPILTSIHDHWKNHSFD